MLILDDLFELVYHYRVQSEKDCFNKAIELASAELDDVLDDTREYPPFVYYLLLAHMDGNDKYYGRKFSTMSRQERIDLFNDTIIGLKKLAES